MRPYTLIIDHEACCGCKTCEVACKQENDPTDGIKLIHISENGPKMVDGRLDFVFHVNVCQHCDEPPCVEACAVEAITRRDDGIVIIDYEECTGCQVCIDECPYNAIAFDGEKGLAQKCNLCYHRVDEGLLPACADNICPSHCVYFGDPDEIDMVIMEKRKKRRTV